MPGDSVEVFPAEWTALILTVVAKDILWADGIRRPPADNRTFGLIRVHADKPDILILVKIVREAIRHHKFARKCESQSLLVLGTNARIVIVVAIRAHVADENALTARDGHAPAGAPTDVVWRRRRRRRRRRRGLHEL